MTVELLAPAKINLGLEVIRRREDGYHNIATVFQTISIFDRIRISPADRDEVAVSEPSLQTESNLALRALELVNRTGLTQGGVRIELEKRIPVAAGLGGASADAAAVLQCLSLRSDSERFDLPALALQLGSDVPFLLQGGAALATGRGEILQACPSLRDCWLVLASPAIEIERKTATLYAALGPSDFSGGAHATEVASALHQGRIPKPADLGNAFRRPLLESNPEIAGLVTHFHAAGAPFVALSGAGPTHYTVVRTLSDAMMIASRLSRRPPIPLRALVARPVPSGIQHKTLPARTAL